MTNITKYENQNKDLDILKTMAKIAIDSGKYSGFDHASIMNVFLTARALNVDPFIALQNFSVVNGKLNMGAHFMSALARRRGHSMKVVEMSDQKCVIIAKRKDNEDSLKYEMTLEEAAKAGLTGKKNWQTNPKQMLYCACVRNIFRMLFSDIAIPYDADEMNVESELSQTEDIGLMEVAESTPQVYKSEIVMDNPLEALKQKLHEDGTSSDRLEEWVKLRCQAKNQPPEVIINTCLESGVIDAFKKSFKRWIDSFDAPQMAVV